jgi:hypothetical protein
MKQEELKNEFSTFFSLKHGCDSVVLWTGFTELNHTCKKYHDHHLRNNLTSSTEQIISEDLTVTQLLKKFCIIYGA